MQINHSTIATNTLVERAARSLLKLIPSGTVVPILRGALRGRRWVAGSSNHACWLGTYEVAKRTLFEQTVVAGNIVYDIGAHVGYYSLLASVLCGATGQVVAFEPLPRNTRYLNEHLRLNHLKNVRVMAVAVADRSADLRFSEGQNSYEGRLGEQGDLTVQAVALDDLVAAGTIPSPDVIKIDVEGAEHAVLLGALRVLEQARPAVFLATHSPNLHRDCCAQLEALGYALQPIGAAVLDQTDEVLAWQPRRPAARPMQ